MFMYTHLMCPLLCVMKFERAESGCLRGTIALRNYYLRKQVKTVKPGHCPALNNTAGLEDEHRARILILKPTRPIHHLQADQFRWAFQAFLGFKPLPLSPQTLVLSNGNSLPFTLPISNNCSDLELGVNQQLWLLTGVCWSGERVHICSVRQSGWNSRGGK